MHKKLFDVAIIENYTINDKVKEQLTLSDIHKTPLYADEYENFLLKIENEILKEKDLEKELWIINNSNKVHSRSRNLIKKFKY